MKTFRHILVPIDFGTCTARAVDTALGLAETLDAKVTLLHVATMPPAYAMAYAEGLNWPYDELDTAARRELDKVVDEAKKRYGRVQGMMTTGDAREQIVSTAQGGSVDLIVMGTHGRRGLARAFLGSVAERVVRTSTVPVLTVTA